MGREGSPAVMGGEGSPAAMGEGPAASADMAAVAEGGLEGTAWPEAAADSEAAGGEGERAWSRASSEGEAALLDSSSRWGDVWVS